MNITFFIGNGFDLNLGLKTRYIDVYRGYINLYSDNNVINDFKLALRDDSMKNYKNWSDFEMGMADYAVNFTNEIDFKTCVRDFKAYMVEHLIREEELFEASVRDVEISRIRDAFNDCVNNFYMGLVPNAITQLKRLGIVSSVKFINLNYTETLDKFIFATIGGEDNKLRNKYTIPLHIHGRLNGDVVLGVDDEQQINNKSFKLTNSGRRTFVKPHFNTEYDSGRVELAYSNIKYSDVIYAYGASFGESDKTWTEKIKEWLLDNENHHLIFNYFDNNTYNKCNSDQILDVEEGRKIELLSKMILSEEEREKLYSQVHIPIGYNIFKELNSVLEAHNVLNYSLVEKDYATT